MTESSIYIYILNTSLSLSLSLYLCRSDGPTTEVPVRYMSGERIPYRRPPSAHSRSSGGGKGASSTLGDRSTLSMQRSGKKKKPQSFKKRARKRVAISDSFFTNSLHREAAVSAKGWSRVVKCRVLPTVS